MSNFSEYKPILEAELKEPLMVFGLSHGWSAFQRECGHRHSTDDAMTAWYGLQKAPNVLKALDLGTGIGSVGLAVLAGLPNSATLTCVEAQAISFRLLQANVHCNQIEDRVRMIHGDLRSLSLHEKFPLITGSPPYFPTGTGVLPEDSQKQHARFELRGGVGDYARAAKKHLSDDGVFVFCFPFQQKNRALSLVRNEGFSIATVRDVFPHQGKPALFSLFSAKLTACGETITEPPFIVSDAQGMYTEEMNELQKSRGFKKQGKN